MDLHYSQTTHAPCPARSGFTTLWIYTILKRRPCGQRPGVVSLPYGFTLFSNVAGRLFFENLVSLPYGFTLFSNIFVPSAALAPVSLPYGFTLFSNAKDNIV